MAVSVGFFTSTISRDGSASFSGAKFLLAQSMKDWGTRMVFSRLENPTDTAITDYFQQKNYETEGNNLDAGKTTYFLRLITAIVMGVGLFISILSFYILMLSIFLLLQKNTVKLENLLLIGYSPTRLATPYYILIIFLPIAKIFSSDTAKNNRQPVNMHGSSEPLSSCGKRFWTTSI